MLFGPGNSLVLLYDILLDSDLDAFQEQVVETAKYYKGVLLSELVENNTKRKSGYFSVCFKQARKNFQLNVLPLLLKLDVPCTLFLQPECIGTNRLPLLEEIAWFRKEYPAKINESQLSEWEKLIRKDQEVAEQRLQVLRKEIGALPVQNIGPDAFYMKWGDLLDLNPKQFEFGLHLYCDSEEWVIDSKRYAETQLSRKLVTSYCAYDTPFTEDKMRHFGFNGLVTERVGTVETGKTNFNLPQWRF